MTISLERFFECLALQINPTLRFDDIVSFGFSTWPGVLYLQDTQMLDSDRKQRYLAIHVKRRKFFNMFRTAQARNVHVIHTPTQVECVVFQKGIYYYTIVKKGDESEVQG